MIPTDNISIMEVDEMEIIDAHALVMRVFDAFIGVGYSAEGCGTFKTLITQEYIASLPKRNGFSLVAKHQGRIVGLFSVRDSNFITLFFIDPDYHRQGIGKRLFSTGKKRIIEQNGSLKKIEVHSSPYAENFYAALGFIKTGDEKEEAGIRFVPMEFLL